MTLCRGHLCVVGDELSLRADAASRVVSQAGDLKRQLRKALEREARFDERVIWKYFSQIVDGAPKPRTACVNARSFFLLCVVSACAACVQPYIICTCGALCTVISRYAARSCSHLR